MHYLHKILVYIPYVKESCGEASNKSELMNNIRMYAEHETEEYYCDVFDWRETQTAGRWESEYPENVLLAVDNIQDFTDELREVKSYQDSSVDYALSRLKGTVGTDLEKIVKDIWDRDDDLFGLDSSDNWNVAMSSICLKDIAFMLSGIYTSDSMFYNTFERTARLYPSDIRKVENNPENWALVMFDYHD